MSEARCIHCGTDDVECTGSSKHDLDEYYCHECEKYFEIDWDEQDEIEAEYFERVGEDEAEDEEDDGGDY